MAEAMMMGSFHWGTQETILFSGLVTDTVVKYAISLVVVFFLSLLLQFLITHLGTNLHHSVSSSKQQHQHYHHDEEKGLLGKVSRKQMILLKSKDTILFGVATLLSYWLMLIVMTYNIGLLLVVVGGSMLGYVLFSTQQSIDSING